MRKKVRTLKLNYNPDSDISVSVATTKQEILEAHSLCYNVYLQEGYSKESYEKLRLSIFHALPTTTTFIAKYKDKIIGTLMAISDGPLGLPSDDFFDLSSLRNSHLRVVEGSGYAIDKNFRGAGSNIFFLLYKYFFNYVENYLGADCTVAAINPKQKKFYKEVLLFDTAIENVVEASSANGAPAVLMSLNLREYQSKYLKHYGESKDAGNLYKFVFNFESENLKFPQKKGLHAGLPVLSPSLLKSIFHEEWSLVKNVNELDLHKLREVYPEAEFDCFFNTSEMPTKRKYRREARFQSNAKVKILNGNLLSEPLLIQDVSENGLKIKYNELHIFEHLKKVKITLTFSSTEVELMIEPVWVKGRSVGYRIVNSPAMWRSIISESAKQLAIA